MGVESMDISSRVSCKAPMGVEAGVDSYSRVRGEAVVGVELLGSS